MAGLKTAIIAALVALLIGASGGAAVSYRYQEARWTAAVKAQEAEAARTLQAETERALAAERAHARLRDELELTHAENKDALDRAYAESRRAVAAAGGLHDPGRRPGGGCPVPAAAGAADQRADATAAGRLSAEAEGFLWDFARDADRAAEYARLCHGWAAALTGEHQP